LLEFWVEEQDMPDVIVGNRIEIIFDALQDLTFSGEVVKIDPALVTVDRTLAVQAWAAIDVGSYGEPLLSGMNAEVEVISAESRDTLLVPLQALRELGPDSYAIFVVGADGELELRIVEVGLTDLANAEILSGLEAGETISLGVDQTAAGVAVPDQEQMGMPGMPGVGGLLEGGRTMPGGGERR
jgi:multidrug efflux pump subunit AcrA (membrane-fusion protein)